MSTYEIRGGFVIGELYSVPVRHFKQDPYAGLAEVKPNLVMHTTETDGYVEHLEYPSQWQVGEGFIGQHKPLWAKGEALRGDTTNDPFAMQIEIVGRSQLDVWLPRESSLTPLVALVAFLHRKNFIRTGLKRPTNRWPTRLDRGPQAVEGYYRRHAGLWPSAAGVYGHVEIPGNSHWDPGSFDYSRFFGMVQATLRDEEDEMAFREYVDGEEAYRAKFKQLGTDPGPPPDAKPVDFKKGWASARFAATNPK